MAVLTRRPKSGFVLYPKDATQRTVDGTARFRTHCDVLVGPCACGNVHQENDGWVQEILEDCGHSLETLVLIPNSAGEIKMPRYWVKPPDHTGCDMLHGRCRCGKIHRANEAWVVNLLAEHQACLKKCPAALEAIVPEPTVESTHNDPDVPAGCDCDACRAQAQRQHRTRRTTRTSLNRRDI
jgi:hypothetical protein